MAEHASLWISSGAARVDQTAALARFLLCHAGEHCLVFYSLAQLQEVFPEEDKVLSDQGRRPIYENRFRTFGSTFLRRENRAPPPWTLVPRPTHAG